LIAFSLSLRMLFSNLVAPGCDLLLGALLAPLRDLFLIGRPLISSLNASCASCAASSKRCLSCFMNASHNSASASAKRRTSLTAEALPS